MWFYERVSRRERRWREAAADRLVRMRARQNPRAVCAPRWPFRSPANKSEMARLYIYTLYVYTTVVADCFFGASEREGYIHIVDIVAAEDERERGKERTWWPRSSPREETSRITGARS